MLNGRQWLVSSENGFGFLLVVVCRENEGRFCCLVDASCRDVLVC